MVSYPQGIAADLDSNIYFAGQNKIHKLSTGGIVTTVAGNPPPALLYGTTRIASGNLSIKARNAGTQVDISSAAPAKPGDWVTIQMNGLGMMTRRWKRDNGANRTVRDRASTPDGTVVAYLVCL